ncbi:hypothetical protein CD29_05480 [Ureibacillus manganicus DSM 26584]|uniref:Uncharacterized protein n=1 Tax=Ureibacillus manganicus DSM 26584 TaxID=1384049 RepID=A0A0A3I7Q0_9BACL|nr:hypothetical protein CD29_05480 [Ureibacillus manganicus DSM 26584]
MFVWGILLIVSSIPITAILTHHLRKQSKLKLEALKFEIELEKQRKESYVIESEKLRLEIEQTRQQLVLDQPYVKTQNLTKE